MKNIIVAVDFSDLTDTVLAQAVPLAAAFSSRLCLLHVAEADPDFVGYDVGPKTTRDAVAGRFRDQHKALQRIAEEVRASGLDCEALLVQGPYVEKIISEAEKIGADIIVIGAHSKGLLSRVLLGSVSAGVLKESKVPVLVVPAT